MCLCDTYIYNITWETHNTLLSTSSPFFKYTKYKNYTKKYTAFLFNSIFYPNSLSFCPRFDIFGVDVVALLHCSFPYETNLHIPPFLSLLKEANYALKLAITLNLSKLQFVFHTINPPYGCISSKDVKTGPSTSSPIIGCVSFDADWGVWASIG